MKSQSLKKYLDVNRIRNKNKTEDWLLLHYFKIEKDKSLFSKFKLHTLQK